jgi:uncharacterized membrane protein YebE (DUF533 family)
MSFGNLLGQLVQNGLGGSAPAQSRVQGSEQHLRSSQLDGIFGQIQNQLSRRGVGGGSSGSGSGFAQTAETWLRGNQVGTLSGAQVGGIGAVAGALLGGGVGGAAKGGAMAVLGTLALGALRNARNRQETDAASGTASMPAEITEADADAVTHPDMERVVLKAMLNAAKADGQIDKEELKTILGKTGDLTDSEKQLVISEMSGPVDIDGIARDARTPAQAAEVYAASLMAIHVDTDDERQYLARLATALGLDAATVEELHKMTGASV